MALLNLDKFKKTKPDEKGAGIPDELPPLPSEKKQAAAPQPITPPPSPPISQPIPQPAIQSAPIQQAPVLQVQPAMQPSPQIIQQPHPSIQTAQQPQIHVQEQPHPAATKLAPDELPPLSAISSQNTSKPQQAPPVMQPRPEASISVPDIDGKLFFSELMARFHDKDQKGFAEKEIIEETGEIISKMNDQWEADKQEHTLADVEQKILEKMQPLRKMEQEWRILKTDIDIKSRLLKEKEKEIKQSAQELKDLFLEKNKLIEKDSTAENNHFSNMR